MLDHVVMDNALQVWATEKLFSLYNRCLSENRKIENFYEIFLQDAIFLTMATSDWSYLNKDETKSPTTYIILE